MQTVKSLPLYALALLLLIFTGFPFFFMVNTAFKGQFEFITSPWNLPKAFKFDNFLFVLKGDFIIYFANSLVVSATSVVVVILIGAMASYPLARMRFKLNRAIYFLFIVGMMIPIHTTLIPIYVLTKNMGIYDTKWALIGPYIAFALPISIFIFSQFLLEIPRELEEAARIDGSGHYGVFWRIMFPLLTPAIATVAIYNFINIWNEFVFALVLTSSKGSMTLPLGLREFYGEFAVNVPGIMGALTLGSLPLLIIYFAAQEKVVKGLSAGAVKG